MEWIIISILVIALAGLLIAINIGIKRMEAKIKFYEDNQMAMAQYIIDVRTKVDNAYQVMKEADLRGAFEADDEVGDVFKLMKQIVDDLDAYIKIEEAKEIEIS